MTIHKQLYTELQDLSSGESLRIRGLKKSKARELKDTIRRADGSFQMHLRKKLLNRYEMIVEKL